MDKTKKYDFYLHVLVGTFCGLMLALVLFSLNVHSASNALASIFSATDQPEELIAEEEIPAISKSVYTHLLLEDGSIIER